MNFIASSYAAQGRRGIWFLLCAGLILPVISLGFLAIFGSQLSMVRESPLPELMAGMKDTQIGVFSLWAIWLLLPGTLFVALIGFLVAGVARGGSVLKVVLALSYFIIINVFVLILLWGAIVTFGGDQLVEFTDASFGEKATVGFFAVFVSVFFSCFLSFFPTELVWRSGELFRLLSRYKSD